MHRTMISITLPFITIDGAHTRDIDDAFHLVRDMGRGWTLSVAIAHVAALVHEGDEIDQQARARAVTLYAGTQVLERMLPAVLSEDAGSLVADESRDALVCTIDLSENLDVTAFEIHEARIQVAARLSYEDVPDVSSDAHSPHGEMVREACTLGRLLYRRRRRNGALAFFDDQRLLLADEDGAVRALRSEAEALGHLLIQEFMILTNRLCAEYALKHDIPVIFRNHRRPAAAPPSADFTATMEAWANSLSPEDWRARQLWLLGTARYDAYTRGHDALALPAYLHVASPLRRYADLFKQRALVASLRGAPLVRDDTARAALATHLSDVIQAQREARNARFQEAVLRRSRLAVNNDSADSLDDGDLTQALKLVEPGQVPPTALGIEIARRLQTGVASDKLVFSVFVRLRAPQLTKRLRTALSQWLHARPDKSVSLLSHLKQRQAFTAIDLQVTGVVSFMATAKTSMDGARLEASATGSTKKLTTQIAMLRLVLQGWGLPAMSAEPRAASEAEAETTRQSGLRNVAAPQLEPVKSVPRMPDNAKGGLLTWCQQHRLPIPEFVVSSSGPPNQPVFRCETLLTQTDTPYVGVGEGTTRRAAERAAAVDLLAHLKGGEKTEVMNDAFEMGADHPVSRLQMAMQRRGAGMPQYRFTQRGDTEPRFHCMVTFDKRQARSATGTGASKRAAKADAAEQALAMLRGQTTESEISQ